MHFRHGFAVLTAFAVAMSCSAALAHDIAAGMDPDKPEIRATRVNRNTPVIDGFLNDDIWNDQQLEFARDFKQIRPEDGELMTESTTVAVVYDDEAMYFAFWCYDSEPDKIARQMVRRDRFGEAGLIAVRLDPFHDHQNGYDFYVNAAGVQCDLRLFNDANSDDTWDAVWQSDVQMQPWGWSVEMRIPFSCLRFNEKDEHIWGADFARAINRKNESGRWAHKTIAEGGFASNFGHITGLRGIRPARHLQVLPYQVTTRETFEDAEQNKGDVGLDVKYGVSSDLTLDATVNPDFGQVELDEPVLNLSTYETFYSERRPFFMEGSDLFYTEYRMFYSRRIGRTPPGQIWMTSWPWYDDKFVDYTTFPRATTILGAAKLTGKLSSGTSIAFLSAVTNEEKAEYLAIDTIYSVPDGDSTIPVPAYEAKEGVVEPKAIYSVLRVKQDVMSNSSIGGILTLVSQEKRYPAVTGAADWRLYTSNNYWCLRGQTVFSHVDNEHVGFANDLVFEKVSGKHVRGAVGTVIKDPYLDINRIGYTNRADYREGWIWLQYRTSDDWWIIRDSWNNFNLSAAWNYERYNISKNCNFNNEILFTNNWNGGFGISASFPDYDDRETRGNGVWEAPESWSAWVWIDTDERRKLSFEFDYAFGNSRTSPWWSGEFLVRYRPISTMQFVAYTEYVHDWGQLMWGYNHSGVSYFADKDQDILDLSLSADVMIHRNMSCQISANGLLTGLDYERYRPYIPHGRYGDALTQYNRDSWFDRIYCALNSTALIRWEYCPGSTMYLVWTRSLEEVDFSVNHLVLSRDIKKLFSGDAYNVFLLKISYWMNI